MGTAFRTGSSNRRLAEVRAIRVVGTSFSGLSLLGWFAFACGAHRPMRRTVPWRRHRKCADRLARFASRGRPSVAANLAGGLVSHGPGHGTTPTCAASYDLGRGRLRAACCRRPTIACWLPRSPRRLPRRSWQPWNSAYAWLQTQPICRPSSSRALSRASGKSVPGARASWRNAGARLEWHFGAHGRSDLRGGFETGAACLGVCWALMMVAMTFGSDVRWPMAGNHRAAGCRAHLCVARPRGAGAAPIIPTFTQLGVDDVMSLRIRRALEDIQGRLQSRKHKELDDLMRAWKGIKDLPPDNPNSFFMIGGFHGRALPWWRLGQFHVLGRLL